MGLTPTRSARWPAAKVCRFMEEVIDSIPPIWATTEPRAEFAMEIRYMRMEKFSKERSFSSPKLQTRTSTFRSE